MACLSVLVAFPVLAAEATLPQSQANMDLTQVGSMAPMFRLPVYNPETNPLPSGPQAVGPDQYVGKIAVVKDVKTLLVAFVSSSMKDSKKQIATLQSLSNKYQAQGFRLIAVAVDEKPAQIKKMEGLIKAHKVNFPVLKDQFRVVCKRWLGTKMTIPSQFLIKPDTTIGMMHLGALPPAKLISEIEAALAAAAAPAAPEKPAAN